MNILNVFSVIATFAVAQILFYIFFNIIFFNIQILNKTVVSQIQVKHVLYFSITTILLVKYTTFYLPY